MDWGLTRKSVEKLADLRPNVVGCGHGIPMRDGALPDRLKRFRRSLSSAATRALCRRGGGGERSGSGGAAARAIRSGPAGDGRARCSSPGSPWAPAMSKSSCATSLVRQPGLAVASPPEGALLRIQCAAQGRAAPLRASVRSVGVRRIGPVLDEALPGPPCVLPAGAFDLRWSISSGPEVILSAKSSSSFEFATRAIAMCGPEREMIGCAPWPRFPGKSELVVGVGVVVATEIAESLAGLSGSSNGGAWSSGSVVRRYRRTFRSCFHCLPIRCSSARW